MGKGDYQQLKADPEDGTTPIANLLLEALAAVPLSGHEKGAVLFLWRRTYGWQNGNNERRKEDTISLTEWADALSTTVSYASRVLAALVDKRVMLRTDLGQGKGYVYTTNTMVAEWDKGYLKRQPLSKKITPSDTKRGGYLKRQPLSKLVSEPLSKKITPSDTKLASPKEKERKDNSILDIDTISLSILEFWNNLGIIKHKAVTEKIKKAVKATLKDYDAYEITTAMQTYAEVLHGKQYRWSYKWTLADFLARGIEKFIDGDVARGNYVQQSKPGAQPTGAQGHDRDKYTSGRYGHVVKRRLE